MKKVKKQNISLDVQVSALDYFKGDMQLLPPNKTYQLIIDYSVSNWATYKIHTGKSGIGLNRLLTYIGKAYNKVYAAEDKYGVWGHGINDLALEGINIDHTSKTIRLQVGS